ncbi:MAG: hypothetical protein D6725_00910 [Planctomycetota bacterium]|nr:MAG: hypothetical protein D6725_00910 [Planctomycetota bacterium]
MERHRTLHRCHTSVRQPPAREGDSVTHPNPPRRLLRLRFGRTHRSPTRRRHESDFATERHLESAPRTAAGIDRSLQKANATMQRERMIISNASKATAVRHAVPALLSCLALALLLSAPGCAALRPMNGIPARYLPDELKAPRRSGKKTIDLSLLRQTPPAEYLLDAGDVLGIYIEGVLGRREDVPPVHFPQNQEVPPALGYPIPVRDDGTISLPLIPPVSVRGLTLRGVEQALRRAYTVDRHILKPGRDRILVSLLKARTYPVLVIRQESGTDTASVSVTGFNLGRLKRGTGRVVNLPAYRNDVLHALAETGGLPGLDAENTIYIIRSRRRPVPPSAVPGRRDALTAPSSKPLAPSPAPGHPGTPRFPSVPEQDTHDTAVRQEEPSSGQALPRLPQTSAPAVESRPPLSNGLVPGHGPERSAPARPSIPQWPSAPSGSGPPSAPAPVPHVPSVPETDGNYPAPPPLGAPPSFGPQEPSFGVPMSWNAFRGKTSPTGDHRRTSPADERGQGFAATVWPGPGGHAIWSMRRGPFGRTAAGVDRPVVRAQSPDAGWGYSGNAGAAGTYAPLRTTSTRPPYQTLSQTPHPQAAVRSSARGSVSGGGMMPGQGSVHPMPSGYDAAGGMVPPGRSAAVPYPTPDPFMSGWPSPYTVPRAVPADGTVYGVAEWMRQVAGYDDATIDNPRIIKIPVRLAPGETISFTEQDVILNAGDIVFIESRDTEIFYTGGLLGGGQFTLPRDYDIDVLDAIAIAQGQNNNRGGGGTAGLGFSALNQDVTISASNVIILRRLENGTQVPIKVDLYRALRYPQERVLIRPGDYIILQYTPIEAVAAFLERHVLQSAIFGIAAAQVSRGR